MPPVKRPLNHRVFLLLSLSSPRTSLVGCYEIFMSFRWLRVRVVKWLCGRGASAADEVRRAGPEEDRKKAKAKKESETTLGCIWGGTSKEKKRAQ